MNLTSALLGSGAVEGIVGGTR